MTWRLGDLAKHLNCELIGDPATPIDGVADPSRAQRREIAALYAAAWAGRAPQCRAGALLVAKPLKDGRPQLVAPRPKEALARLIEAFLPAPRATHGIHDSAIVSPRARVHRSASVGAFAYVDADAIVEEGAQVGAYAYVGAGSKIGAASEIGVRSTVCAGVEIGPHAKIGVGAVIGGPGFGFYGEGDALRRIPSAGGVRVGEGAEIGAQTCIDAGTLAPTKIGSRARIDNLVQVGHNVTVGDGALVCAQSGIAGSAIVGDGAVLGGQVGVADHAEIGAEARIGAKSGVGGDVPPKQTYSGYPAMPHRQWLRGVAMMRRLGRLWHVLRRFDA